MLSCEHDVQQHPKRIDIRPLVGLGNAVLLRGGIACGAQNLGVVICLAFENTGSVKVDEHRFPATYNHVFRLDVPVHRPQFVQHPQGVAELQDNFPGLGGGEQRALEKIGQGISLYVFLQHCHHAVLLCRLHDLRQIRAGDPQKLPIDLPVPTIMAKNKPCPVLPVLQKRNTAALAAFECSYGFVVLLNA